MKDLSTFDSLDKIYVRSQNSPATTASNSSTVNANAMVPLSNLVSLTKSVRQNNLYRYNRMDSADISADLSSEYSLGPVVQHVRAMMQRAWCLMGKVLPLVTVFKPLLSPIA